MDTYDLKKMSVAELEKLLEMYPWYAGARRELFLKMSAMGEDYRKDILHHAVLYLYPDYSVFREAYVLSSTLETEVEEPAEHICELDFTETSEVDTAGLEEYGKEAEVEIGTGSGSEPPVQERKVYIVGGDYFMPEELKGVQSQDIHGLGTRPATSSPRVQTDSTEFTDEAFYTETLARIYAQQELYDRANEVYEKLILLYPEKSAYFAALKNDIKKHL